MFVVQYFVGRNRAIPEIEDSRRRGRNFQASARNRLPPAAEDADYERWYGQGEREEEVDFEDAMPVHT